MFHLGIKETSPKRPIDEYVLNPLTRMLNCDVEYLHSHPFIRAYLKMRMRKDSLRPLIYLNLTLYTGLVIFLTGLTFTFSIRVLKSYFFYEFVLCNEQIKLLRNSFLQLRLPAFVYSVIVLAKKGFK